MLQNPFPETCTFATQERALHLTEVHPLEVSIGNTFLSASRRAEFFSGRRCAHLAMSAAGYPALPILRSSDRSPLWPLAIIGSITHGASLAAAIVGGRHQHLMGLGIDIEDLTREMRTDISRHTLTPWEIDRWKATSSAVSRETRLIFSIKETIYKCFYPVQKVSLGFQDAEVTEIGVETFQARLLKTPFRFQIPLPLLLEGKLQCNQKLVFSALLIREKQFDY